MITTTITKAQLNLNKKIGKLVDTKYAERLRKFEVRIGNDFRRIVTELAPSGEVKDHGESDSLPTLKEILGKLKTRKDTLRSGIYTIYKQGKKGSGRITIHVISKERAETKKIRWVNDGTGIYGPYGEPIVSSRKAETGGRLKFEYKGETVFATEVKGQRGKHFIEQARIVMQTVIGSGKIKF